MKSLKLYLSLLFLLLFFQSLSGQSATNRLDSINEQATNYLFQLEFNPNNTAIIDSFEFYSNQLKRIGETEDNYKATLLYLFVQGIFLDFQQDLPKALIIFEEGLEIARANQDNSEEVLFLREIGVVLQRQGKLGVSMDTFQKALGLAKIHGLSGLEVSVGANILYGLQSYFPEDSANIKLLETLYLKEIVRWAAMENEIEALKSSCYLHFVKKEYDKVPPLVTKLESISDESVPEYKLLGLRAAALLVQDTTRLIEVYEDWLKPFLDKKEEPPLFIDGMKRLVDVLIVQRKTERAFFWAEKYHQLGKDRKLTYDIYKSADQLSLIYEQMGNYEQAFLFSKLKEEKEVEMFGSQGRNQFRFNNYNLEIQKNQLANTLLEKELEIAKQNRQFYLFLISTIILALVALAFFLFKSRQNHRERKEQNNLLKLNNEALQQKNELIEEMNQKLDTKSKEQGELLTQNTLFLSHKNELIKKMNQLLSSSEDISKLKKELGGILRQEQSKGDANWNELNQNFELNNQEFVDGLLLKHPNLSTHEIRLCIFLKLNLTTKEIAALTFRKADSIKVSRSRLRKKLGLTNRSDKISTYLANL